MSNKRLRKIDKLHQKAMMYADAAFVAKHRCENRKIPRFERRAYKYESKAARMLADDLSIEPTRSVLYRSAASMAVTCKEFDDAEKLIAEGLAGNPPAEMAEELRQVKEWLISERARRSLK